MKRSSEERKPRKYQKTTHNNLDLFRKYSGVLGKFVLGCRWENEEEI
jgi:hypothetical protein